MATKKERRKKISKVKISTRKHTKKCNRDDKKGVIAFTLPRLIDSV